MLTLVNSPEEGIEASEGGIWEVVVLRRDHTTLRRCLCRRLIRSAPSLSVSDLRTLVESSVELWRLSPRIWKSLRPCVLVSRLVSVELCRRISCGCSETEEEENMF
ncbi:uncharacterized protein G2W53_022115 [Senna tora]|uniref:Uncharacterized protein n=1 Tax=Senna tora TaxID=362788 RepID=A0A834WLR5_9FABA|nr:uncharacterized protein G2W53_022115 [Senna tora]